MQVLVCGAREDQQVLVLDTVATDSALTLLEQVGELCGIPNSVIRLTYKGKTLKYNESLLSTVLASMRLLGGSKISLTILCDGAQTRIQNIQDSDTVYDVKLKVAGEFGYCEDAPSVLIIGNTTVLDYETIAELGIKDGDYVHFNTSSRFAKAVVQMNDGTRITRKVSPITKVVEIKYWVQRQTEIPITRQALFFRGQKLHDCNTVASLGNITDFRQEYQNDCATFLFSLEFVSSAKSARF